MAMRTPRKPPRRFRWQSKHNHPLRHRLRLQPRARSVSRSLRNQQPKNLNPRSRSQSPGRPAQTPDPGRQPCPRSKLSSTVCCVGEASGLRNGSRPMVPTPSGRAPTGGSQPSGGSLTANAGEQRLQRCDEPTQRAGALCQLWSPGPLRDRVQSFLTAASFVALRHRPGALTTQSA